MLMPRRSRWRSRSKPRSPAAGASPSGSTAVLLPALALRLLAALLLAAVADRGPEIQPLPVLGGEVDFGLLLLAADVFGVDQEPLLAALHFKDELGHRGVGDRFEGVADAPPLGGVDLAVHEDPDLAVEVSDQVREVVPEPGAQVDRPLQRLVEQR